MSLELSNFTSGFWNIPLEIYNAAIVNWSWSPEYRAAGNGAVAAAEQSLPRHIR